MNIGIGHAPQCARLSMPRVVSESDRNKDMRSQPLFAASFRGLWATSIQGGQGRVTGSCRLLVEAPGAHYKISLLMLRKSNECKMPQQRKAKAITLKERAKAYYLVQHTEQ